MSNAKTKFSEIQIEVQSEDVRKAAFASFNRDVNLEHVKLIFEKMKIKGYRSSETIRVIKAENATDFGITRLFDLNGTTILQDEFCNYYLVVDGQHRTYSASLYNQWLIGEGATSINVPAIEVVFKNGESISEYCNEISYTKKEWTKEDYLKGAANYCVNEPLLQRYKELIKTESNPSGFSLSTLNLIFCSSSGALSKNDFILLCSGEKKKGKANRDIIHSYDLDNGNQYIAISKEVGFMDSEIAKRYLINEFNRIKNSSRGKEFALKVLRSINRDDRQAMNNISGHLDEDKVIDQFEIIKERIISSNLEEAQLNDQKD